MMSERPLEVTTAQDVAVLRVNEKKLDEPNVHVLGEQFLHLLDELEQPRLELDLGGVEYVSSVALGKIVSLDKRVWAKGKHLTLTHLDSFVYELFEITHLTSVLDVRPQQTGTA
jgi:anti-sigma B factor antagonist